LALKFFVCVFFLICTATHFLHDVEKLELESLVFSYTCVKKLLEKLKKVEKKQLREN
jgi:hypothetical protein